MENFNSFNSKHPENMPEMQLSMEEALSKNPLLVDQAFGEGKSATPGEFALGNERIKEEGFAGLFSELAGFDDSSESQEVATNALAFVDLTARLHGREFDGIGGFDSLFVDGEPISTEDLNKLVSSYLEQNPSVGQLVEQYVSQVDPEEVNPKATERLLATGFYLVDETLEMQVEAEEQTEFDQRFDNLVEAETHQIEVNQRFDDIVSENLSDMRSQESFDKEFSERMLDEYPAPMADYDAEFAEIVEEVKVDGYLDDRTDEQHAQEFDGIVENFSVVGSEAVDDTNRVSVIRSMGELAASNIKLTSELFSSRAEKGRKVARAALDFWTGGYRTGESEDSQ